MLSDSGVPSLESYRAVSGSSAAQQLCLQDGSYVFQSTIYGFRALAVMGGAGITHSTWSTCGTKAGMGDLTCSPHPT